MYKAVNLSISARLLSFLGGLAIAFSSNSAIAQISPDQTLGGERSVITPNVNIKGATADQINGGAIRGSNLFHSFREFNVKDGQRVYFSNPAGINNILGRVTGSSPSNILGTLGVDGNASLFLINPNGIIFGKNASLDVGKSFYATTANGIKFGELGEFSASNPQSPSPLLTINPSAFFFSAQTKPGDIITQSRATQTVQGTPTDGLQVPNGQTLLLLGGNVTVDDGHLIAGGGRVEIGAVAGTGSVGLNANGSLNFPDTIQRADVVFNNQALVDVTHANAGDIGITARNIDVLQASGLLAGIQMGLGTANSQAGDITLNATGEVHVTSPLSRIENDVNLNAIGKGGNVKITADSLVLSNGGQISANTLGVGDAGNVLITVRDRISLNGTSADGELGSDILSAVGQDAKGKVGSTQISANSLEINDGAQLGAITFGAGDAGNVTITANRVFLSGRSSDGKFASAIATGVEADAIGKGGKLEIFTNNLEISNGAQLTSITSGVGDAGSILISARERVFINNSEAFSRVNPTGRGNSGNLQITTNTLEVTNLSQLSASTLGVGNAGNVIITADRASIIDSDVLSRVARTGVGKGGNVQIAANTLEVINGGSLLVNTLGIGDAGNIIINARDRVLFSGQSADGQFQAGAFSEVFLPEARGNGGNIQIATKTLEVTNGGEIFAGTFGMGNAGNIVISADNIFFSGISSRGTISGAFTTVFNSAKGKGGNLQISAKTLELTNGARLASATDGIGDAGTVVISASDRVFLDNGAILSGVSPDAEGKGGNVEISSNILEIQKGGQIIASTVGKGDAGNIRIDAAKTVDINQTNSLTGISSGLFARTNSGGKGGNISVNTLNLHLADGAVIDSRTSANGNSGNITINAAKVDILNGGQILAITKGIGRAGNITVNATQKVTLTGTDSTFGNRLAEFPNAVAPLTPNSGIFVRSQASGGAGEITITAPSLRLEQGNLSAESTTVDGGNITLNPRDILVLRNRSLISATAGTAQQNGNGGNITINAPTGFIVALANENSDITANAFNGSGGEVTINATGIFGLKPRSRQELEQLLQTTDPTKLNPSQLPTSDITAISQTNPSLNGEVNLNTPDIDPSKGLQELPIDIVDVSRLINQNLCVASQGSKFIVTGRGGLPPSPYEILSADTTWEDWWISPQPQTQPTPTTHNSSHKKHTESTTIIEAQGWVIDANGNVILTAKPVTVTPKGSWLHPQDCQTLRS